MSLNEVMQTYTFSYFALKLHLESTWIQCASNKQALSYFN